MILYANLLTTPMQPGEVRYLSARGDEQLTVEIKCFLLSPPPPSFRSCSACGTFPANNDQAVKVEAEETLFRQVGGSLNVHVSDRLGDIRTFTIQVTP